MICQIRLLFSWNRASVSFVFVSFKVVNPTFQYRQCCIPPLCYLLCLLSILSVYYPFSLFHFHLACRCSLTVSSCPFHICKTKLILNTFLLGTAELWNHSPTITQLIFPFVVTEIKNIVQIKLLDCLGMEKLKKEKLFGGKFLLSFLWLQNTCGLQVTNLE